MYRTKIKIFTAKFANRIEQLVNGFNDSRNIENISVIYDSGQKEFVAIIEYWTAEEK